MNSLDRGLLKQGNKLLLKKNCVVFVSEYLANIWISSYDLDNCSEGVAYEEVITAHLVCTIQPLLVKWILWTHCKLYIQIITIYHLQISESKNCSPTYSRICDEFGSRNVKWLSKPSWSKGCDVPAKIVSKNLNICSWPNLIFLN